MALIDTHAHLYYESMESVLSEVLERAGSKGVNKIVCIGTDIDTSIKSVKIAEKYDNVFATVGIHPHDAKDVSSDYIMQLEDLSKQIEQTPGFPQVHLWNPDLCEGVNFNIDRNGEWFYQNSPLTKESLKILFAFE